MKLLSIAILVLLVACNKKDDDTTSTLSEVALGVYTRCENDEGLSLKGQIFYNQSSIVGAFTLYAGSNCVSGQEIFTERDIYSYTKSGTDYVLRTENIIMIPTHSDITTSFNTENFCGIGSWVTGEPKAIVGQNCEGDVFNIGDIQKLAIYKSGSKLVMKEGKNKTSYSRVHAIDYANAAQTLSDGNYAYYDGTTAIYLNIAAPNFTANIYDEASLRYYVKTGTFNSANNVAQLTATTNTPDCAEDEGVVVNRKFIKSISSSTLTMESLEGVDWILEKVSFPLANFRTSYLTSNYVQNCF